MSPTFSILMSSYNYERYILQSVQSVLRQTFPDWELIIVDDCSTDDSWQLLQTIDDPRVQIHRHDTNQGGSAAYNTALELARGEWLACLDSDDLLHPEFLERKLAHVTAHPELDISGSWLEEMDGSSRAVGGDTPLEGWFNHTLDLNDPALWIWANRLAHGTAVISRAAHLEVGPANQRCDYSYDQDLWIRFLAAGKKYGMQPEALLTYRRHGLNYSDWVNSRLVREYAVTCGGVFLPYLLATGREDLAVELVHGFLARPELATESDEFATTVLADLLANRPEHLRLLGPALRLLAQSSEQSHADQRARLAAVEEQVSALSAERETMRARNDELFDESVVLVERVAELQNELAALSARLVTASKAPTETLGIRVAKKVRNRLRR